MGLRARFTSILWITLVPNVLHLLLVRDGVAPKAAWYHPSNGRDVVLLDQGHGSHNDSDKGQNGKMATMVLGLHKKCHGLYQQSSFSPSRKSDAQQNTFEKRSLRQTLFSKLWSAENINKKT